MTLPEHKIGSGKTMIGIWFYDADARGTEKPYTYCIYSINSSHLIHWGVAKTRQRAMSNVRSYLNRNDKI